MADPGNVPAQKRSNDFPTEVVPASTERLGNKRSKVDIQHLGHATPQGAEGFLSLPPELRNRIYELALTTASEVYYQRPRGLHLEALVGCSTPLMVYLMNAKPWHGRVHVFTSREHAKESHSSRPRSFNQLQFVNKQLRNETKGLEFKFNNIACASSLVVDNFYHRMQFSSIPFVTSVTVLSPMDYDLIQSLGRRDSRLLATIHPGALAFDRYITFLCDTATFCKKNSQIQVDYAIDRFLNPSTLGKPFSHVVYGTHSHALWNFVRLGILASIAFDPQGSFAQSAQANTAIWNDPFVQAAVTIGGVLVQRGIFTDVKNLTFYQGNPHFMREQHGTGEIPSTAFIGDGDAPTLRALSKEAWAAHATNWLRNGIRPS